MSAGAFRSGTRGPARRATESHAPHLETGMSRCGPGRCSHGTKRPRLCCPQPGLRLLAPDRGSHDDRAASAYTRRHERRSRRRRRRPSRNSPTAGTPHARLAKNWPGERRCGHRQTHDPHVSARLKAPSRSGMTPGRAGARAGGDNQAQEVDHAGRLGDVDHFTSEPAGSRNAAVYPLGSGWRARTSAACSMAYRAACRMSLALGCRASADPHAPPASSKKSTRPPTTTSRPRRAGLAAPSRWPLALPPASDAACLIVADTRATVVELH